MRSQSKSTGARTADAWAKSRATVKRRATAVINERGERERSLSRASGYASMNSSVSDFGRIRHGSMSSIDSIADPGRRSAANGLTGPSTDPVTIHAITQTMIGEYMYKYTRRTLGRGMSENRHRRFFWVHPYSKTLYWSTQDPGSTGAPESKAKSVFISGIRTIEDYNAAPPGLYGQSIVVNTLGREIQFTAPTKERHDLWITALGFLLAHQGGNGGANTLTPSRATNRGLASTMSTATSSAANRRLSVIPDEHGQVLRSTRSRMSIRSLEANNSTPRASTIMRPASSLSSRRRTHSGARGSGAPPPPRFGGHRFKGTYRAASIADSSTYDEMGVLAGLDDDADDSFEGLDNVRACCDGRHLVGQGHGHHHHGVGRESAPAPSAPATPTRMRSPSIRSRASSILSTVRRSTQGL